MNNKKILALFVASLFLIPLAIGISYPTLTGYVTDNANIITPEYKQKITDLAENINKNTTVEIAVLTVQSLEGDTPENYALNVFRQNGVGKKDNNNGLLILVSKNDRKYRFETGYGLEGTVPDAMKVPIGDKIIIPNFKNGDYGKGIYESILVIEGLVTNNTDVLSQYGLVKNLEGPGRSEIRDRASFVFLFIGIIFAVAILFFLVSLRKGTGTTHSSPPDYTYPSAPTYRSSPSSYSRSSSSNSSSKKRSSSSSNSSSYSSSGSHSSYSSHSSSGFGGFGGGRSGGGGFGGGW